MQLMTTVLAMQVAMPALAHHSQAVYDTTKVVTYDGVVSRLDWKNPHMYLMVEILDEKGNKHLQQFEGLGVTQALVDGFDRNALTPGTHVLVRANPNRGGQNKNARGLDVTTDDGRIQPMYERNAKAPTLVPADGLAGKWAPSLAETNRAFAATAAFKFSAKGAARNQPAACDVEPVPFVAILDELRTIEVGKDTVVFHFDNTGDRADRVVHLDQTRHPAGITPTKFGHSIGHFEGATLVVDTVAYAFHSSGLAGGHPSSPAKHTVERLTLTPDHLHLKWELHMEDPENLAEPANFSMVWDHRPDLEFTTVPCEKAVSDRYLND